MNAPTAFIPPTDWATPRYRACELCQHHAKVADGLRCSHPSAKLHRQAQVALARAAGGWCGPDADRMSFPGSHG